MWDALNPTSITSAAHSIWRHKLVTCAAGALSQSKRGLERTCS